MPNQDADGKRAQYPSRQKGQYFVRQEVQQANSSHDKGWRTEYRYRAQWFILAPHPRFAPLLTRRPLPQAADDLLDARTMPDKKITLNQPFNEPNNRLVKENRKHF
jgi:hypothetical protein